mmetsp:Transcript_46354/g.110374  ORF Transcript_46354/g.110374 Transcript_46354/m.110374 type:complete len:530 (+) Transcript_46354:64-1653(+)
MPRSSANAAQANLRLLFSTLACIGGVLWTLRKVLAFLDSPGVASAVAVAVISTVVVLHKWQQRLAKAAQEALLLQHQSFYAEVEQAWSRSHPAEVERRCEGDSTEAKSAAAVPQTARRRRRARSKEEEETIEVEDDLEAEFVEDLEDFLQHSRLRGTLKKATEDRRHSQQRQQERQQLQEQRNAKPSPVASSTAPPLDATPAQLPEPSVPAPAPAVADADVPNAAAPVATSAGEKAVKPPSQPRPSAKGKYKGSNHTAASGGPVAAVASPHDRGDKRKSSKPSATKANEASEAPQGRAKHTSGRAQPPVPPPSLPPPAAPHNLKELLLGPPAGLEGIALSPKGNPPPMFPEGLEALALAANIVDLPGGIDSEPFILEAPPGIPCTFPKALYATSGSNPQEGPTVASAPVAPPAVAVTAAAVAGDADADWDTSNKDSEWWYSDAQWWDAGSWGNDNWSWGGDYANHGATGWEAPSQPGAKTQRPPGRWYSGGRREGGKGSGKTEESDRGGRRGVGRGPKRAARPDTKASA